MSVAGDEEELATKQFGCFSSEVREDEVCPCTLDRQKAFHHDALTVDPAIEPSSLDHRIFSADLMGSQRKIKAISSPAQDFLPSSRRKTVHDYA